MRVACSSRLGAIVSGPLPSLCGLEGTILRGSLGRAGFYRLFVKLPKPLIHFRDSKARQGFGRGQRPLGDAYGGQRTCS